MQAAYSADWYVDGLNGNNNNTGDLTAPFKDPWKAWGKAQPGDTVHLMPTVTYGTFWLGNRTGLPDAYITIRGTGTSAAMTKISGNGTGYGIMVAPGTNYINIQNLDITAPGHGKTAPWSGIYIKEAHHVNVTNNYVHDAGCSGIQTESADYINIMSNRVAHNAKETFNNIFCSGISTHENLDSDTLTGTKMWVHHNIVYGNTNVKRPDCVSPCTNSDGNGIIIDDTRRTQTDYNAYKGKTLVKNNVVFNNGGRGIAIFYSDNVDVLSNTVYQNNKDPDEGAWRPGEIGVSYSGNINVYNNVFYTDGLYGSVHTGKRVAVSVQDNSGGGPINVDYNLSYAPSNDSTLKLFTRYNKVTVNYGPANKWADPIFNVASLDPAVADFRVKVGSPALNFTPPTHTYPKSDFFWVQRGSYPTAGAYQKPM